MAGKSSLALDRSAETAAGRRTSSVAARWKAGFVMPSKSRQKGPHASAQLPSEANIGDSTMMKIAFATAAIFLISSAGAIGQQPASSRACAADIKARCASVQPGQGRVGACVKEHFNDLSATCQRSLYRAAAAVKKACSSDIEQFCPGVKKGGDRLAICMKPHQADLSPSCKDALAQVAVGGQ